MPKIPDKSNFDCLLSKKSLFKIIHSTLKMTLKFILSFSKPKKS